MGKDKAAATVATKKYLELMGYEYLGEANGFLVYGFDERPGLIFVNACGRIEGNEFPESDRDSLRYEFEKAIIEWINEHPEHVDTFITCDECSVVVINKDRGLVRHAINVLETGWF